MGERRPEAHFADLYRDNYGRLLRFVARRIDDQGEAEDVAAEVFRIAWSKASQGTRLSPAWLFVTAQNTLKNHCRSVNRIQDLRRSIANGLSTRAADHSVVDAVRDALSSLPDHHREILVLRYWDNLTTAEIGVLLNISMSAVWVRMHRARRAFRDSFTSISGGRYAHD